MKLEFSTDRKRMDRVVIHAYLTQSYWSPGVSFDRVSKAIDHSLCFGLFLGEQQIAFGRFITDYTSFAYLADVYVEPSEQGKGYGKMMMQQAFDLPELQGLRRIMLATEDAHTLYEKFGFKIPDDPSFYMVKKLGKSAA